MKTEPEEAIDAGVKADGAEAAGKAADGSADTAPPPTSDGGLQQTASKSVASAAAVKAADTEPPSVADGVATKPSTTNTNGERLLTHCWRSSLHYVVRGCC